MLSGTVVSGGCTGGTEESEELRFDIYDNTGFHILTLVPLYLAARIVGVTPDLLLAHVQQGYPLYSLLYSVKLFKQPTKAELVAQRNAWNTKHRW